MRFRWCGDADCPDWVLAEMTTLSRLSSVKLKLLATLVVQGISSPPFNIEKAEKLLAESKLEDSSVVKRCVSCISWIMRSAARAACDATALGGELQQLGLPREHALALRRVYTDHVDTLRLYLTKESLKVNPLKSATFEVITGLNAVELEIETGKEDKRKVLIPKELLQTVVEDMKNALNYMEELSAADHTL